MSTNFISRYNIGDEILFVSNFDNPQNSTEAKVVKVGFYPGKVTYDIALKVENEYYETRPLRDVDSIFIKDLNSSNDLEMEK